MAVLIVKISTARPTGYLTSLFETAGGARAIAQRLCDYVVRVLSGSEGAMSSSVPPSINLSVQENSVQASATLTGTTVIATNAVVINGVTFTCVASGATGNQFNVGASDTLTMAALAAAINASVTAKIAGYVVATAALTVVTVKSVAYGLSGNLFTITSSQGSIVATGSGFLTGGAADATAQNLTF